MISQDIQRYPFCLKDIPGSHNLSTSIGNPVISQDILGYPMICQVLSFSDECEMFLLAALAEDKIVRPDTLIPLAFQSQNC
jgi:hypothetical protein